MLHDFFHISTDHKQCGKNERNVNIDSAASSGDQGRYRKYEGKSLNNRNFIPKCMEN